MSSTYSAAALRVLPSPDLRPSKEWASAPKPRYGSRAPVFQVVARLEALRARNWKSRSEGCPAQPGAPPRFRRNRRCRRRRARRSRRSACRTPAPRAEPAVFIHLQHVHRDVRRIQPLRSNRAMRSRSRRLAGQARDQVDIEVPDARASRSSRRFRRATISAVCLRPVRASSRWHERLHAQADAIDPGVAPGFGFAARWTAESSRARPRWSPPARRCPESTKAARRDRRGSIWLGVPPPR